MNLSKRSNGVYYVYYFKANGKRTCISTGTKLKSLALKFLVNFENETAKRNLLKFIPISMMQFRREYASYSESLHRPKTTQQFCSILKEFSGYCHNSLLGDINSQLIEKYLQHKAKISNYTAQKHLAYLRSAFNKAVNDKYIERNPFNEIKNFRIPQKQPKFFSEVELEILLRTIQEKDFKDLIIFAVQTGLRQMELITLQWNQINFKERYLILDNGNHITKSKKIRSIPLSLKALQILTERQINSKAKFAFTYNGQQFKQGFLSHRFKKYIRNSGINDNLKFHSLRHTFASWLVQKGVSIFQVSKLLGHSKVSTTEIYTHLRSEDLQNAINVLNN